MNVKNIAWAGSGQTGSDQTGQALVKPESKGRMMSRGKQQAAVETGSQRSNRRPSLSNEMEMVHGLGIPAEKVK